MKLHCPKCKRYAGEEFLRHGELCAACDPDRITRRPLEFVDYAATIILLGGIVAFIVWVASHLRLIWL